MNLVSDLTEPLLEKNNNEKMENGVPMKINVTKLKMLKKEHPYNMFYHTKYQTIQDEIASDTQYRRDMLNVFNVDISTHLGYEIHDTKNKAHRTSEEAKKDIINDEFDLYKLDLFEVITKNVESIYDIFTTTNKTWDTILEISAARMFTTDRLTGFMILFSYQTFHLVHKLIQYYIEFGEYNQPILDAIQREIK